MVNLWIYKNAKNGDVEKMEWEVKRSHNFAIGIYITNFFTLSQNVHRTHVLDHYEIIIPWNQIQK